MFRPSLHKKVLGAFLVLALVPLALLTFYSSRHLSDLEHFLRDSATQALDAQASRALELRAVMVADEISRFLVAVEADLRDLALLPREPEAYLSFSLNHRQEIWFRAGTNADPVELREQVLQYREIAFIAPSGRERIRIVGGGVSSDLRDLSSPANTTYLTEDYFRQATRLPSGAIHITPVTGWHVSKTEQLGKASSPLEAVEGVKYDGVIRFSAPLRDAGGRLEGVLVLSLDHRHLMEFTQHLTPTDERFVVFPSYASGNYAFLFDREGWMISHPKLWDIRGLDRQGRLVPPYSSDSPPEMVEQGIIPFNLLHAGFIHPNYPEVAKAVLSGRSGVMDVTNVGGSHKVMAYAPIRYSGGPFADGGIFGGVTIGAELSQFHRPALAISEVIRREITHFLSRSWLLISLTALMVFLAAWTLSRSITRPLLQLIAGTKEMARGHLDTQVVVSSHDEVGALSRSFNAMARELEERRQGLLQTLQDLRRSRREILRERNFKETVFENIETGILTLDSEGSVTSSNGPARRILHLDPQEGTVPLEELLRPWPEILQVLPEGMGEGREDVWSLYVQADREGRSLTFRLALLPLAFGEEGGQILTVEDLTERVNMRHRMERMNRLASLGRMAAGIAHEVRNPLTGISLLLDELHDRLLQQPGDQNLIRRALEEIERLETLVGELLHFASLPQTRLAPGDVGEVLEETLFLFRKRCEKQGVVLQEEIAEGLPLIPIDGAKLKQAFLNLLTNALEAMPRGGSLEVSVRLERDEMRISIRDTGEGIPAERIPLVFEPFYTSKAGGTGLGLAVTHNIASEHGGRIEVQSSPGEGATFVLHLPLPPRARNL